MEPVIMKLKSDMSNFWPIDFCGPQVQKFILKNSEKMNKTYCIILALFGVTGLAMLPVWGDEKDWFLCVTVYQHYFGKWTKIPDYIYFITASWLSFFCNSAKFYGFLCSWIYSNASLFN